MELLRRRRAGSNVGVSEAGSQRSLNTAGQPAVAFAQPRMSSQSGIELRPLIDGARARKIHPSNDRIEEEDEEESGRSGGEMNEEEEAELEQLAISAVMTADELDCKDEG